MGYYIGNGGGEEMNSLMRVSVLLSLVGALVCLCSILWCIFVDDSLPRWPVVGVLVFSFIGVSCSFYEDNRTDRMFVRGVRL